MILVLRGVLSFGNLVSGLPGGNELSSAQSKVCRLMRLQLSVVPEAAEES